jgi:hypothetical protein
MAVWPAMLLGFIHLNILGRVRTLLRLIPPRRAGAKALASA